MKKQTEKKQARFSDLPFAVSSLFFSFVLFSELSFSLCPKFFFLTGTGSADPVSGRKDKIKRVSSVKQDLKS